ncbi:MAG: glycoside hydrolase domain-containing protein [Streptosporangiaceae bacterium]
MKTVEFRGYTFKVPANWPVYQLSKDPSQCVRYDVNAVYLGTPGANQDCPPDLVGTADTVTVGGPAIPGVLIVSSAANRRAQAGDLRSGADLPAAPGTIMQNPGQHEFAMSMPSHAPSFTATYGTDPGLIMKVFGSLHAVTSQSGHGTGPLQPRGGPTHPANWGFPSPVTPTTRPHIVPSVVYTPPDNDPSPSHWPTPSPTRTTPAPHRTIPVSVVTNPPPTPPPTQAPASPEPTVTTSTGTSTQAPAQGAPPVQPGAGFSNAVAGFDTCTAPSVATMKAWRAKYAVANIYIGGQEMACDYGNLSASWITAVEAMGWSLMPTFVGLQAPCNSYSAEINPSQAAAQGRAAATLAISDAKQLGLGTGSPIYFDMEGYDHTNAGCKTAVLTFLDAWTRQLDAGDYVSGVYSSADSAAIDLQSNTTIAGRALAEPQDMWFALWDNALNLTGSPYLTGAVWPQTQRSKQYQGGHIVRVGGFSLDIDSDLVDSAVVRG